MLSDSLATCIDEHGYAFVRADSMREILSRFGALDDWPAFAASWNHLELDTYMADHGRYRRRRHGIYAALPDGTIDRKPHQPHYQSLEYNPLHGGVERWFEPIEPSLGSGPSMTSILVCCRSLFEHLSTSPRTWHIEVHQFRIQARSEEEGRPTPEGMHRDGVDFALVLLIERHNIASGTTTIHSLDRKLLGSFTLTDPLDAALVDDKRVFHGVTPVQPVDPALPAYRDVLVVTFRHQ